MKDSKLYADKITKLYRSLKRGHDKVDPVTYDDPLEAIVQGFIAESVPLKQFTRAVKRFQDYFVDLNDVRVARADEIVEVIEAKGDLGLKVSGNLLRVLNALFDQRHELTLMDLKKIGKRPAKQALEELEGLSYFVQCYCMLTALQGHAIPLTDGMITYLKSEGLVHSNADRHDIEGFLSRQISAKDDFEFYLLLKEASESPTSARPTTTRKKTTKKAAKKTTKKTTKKVAQKKVTGKGKKAVSKTAKKTTKKKA